MRMGSLVNFLVSLSLSLKFGFVLFVSYGKEISTNFTSLDTIDFFSCRPKTRCHLWPW